MFTALAFVWILLAKAQICVAVLAPPFTVTPPTVSGGQTITVSYQSFNSDVTFFASYSSSILITSTSLQAGHSSGLFKFLAPTNYNGSVTITEQALDGGPPPSYVLAVAPTITPLTPVLYSQSQTVTLIVSSLNTTKSFSLYLNGLLISSQSGANSTARYFIAAPLSGVQTLTASQDLNGATATFYNGQFTISPSPAVLGGASIVVSVWPYVYNSSITYAATFNATEYARETSPSNGTSWRITVPGTATGPFTVFVTNQSATATSTVTVNTLTFAFPSATLTAHSSFSVTMSGLIDGYYTATFSGSEYTSSISSTAASSVWVITLPSTISLTQNYMLALQESGYAVTSTCTVVPRSDLAYSVTPSTSVFGGSSVTVNVLTLPYASSIYYSVLITGSTVAATTVASNVLSWTFQAPTNVNTPMSIFVSNESSSLTSTITAYAPTFTQPSATITAHSSFFVTMSSLTDGYYTATFSGSSYTSSISTTAISSVWTITLPSTLSLTQNYRLALKESGNAVTSVYTVVPRKVLAYSVTPSTSVFGGSSVTVNVLTLPYASSIYYSVLITGSTVAATTVASNVLSWTFQAPTNVNNPMSIFVSNESSSLTSTITAYAPTFTQPSATITAHSSFFVTMSSLIDGYYTATFSGPAYTSSISTTAISSVWAITLPDTISVTETYALALQESANAVTSVYTVVPRSALAYSVTPSTSVFGGSSVTVNVLTLPYASSIYYSVLITGSTVAATTVASNVLSWTFQAPTNVNNPMSIFVSNESSSLTSTITAYAPTFTQPSATITAHSSFFVTMSSLIDGYYTATFSGPAYTSSISTTAISSVWAITLPDTISVIETYALALQESANAVTSVYTVVPRSALAYSVAPSPSVFGGSSVTVNILTLPYASSIYYSALITGSTVAATTVDSNVLSWTFQAPTNVNNPMSIFVSNESSSMSNSVTLYAPTIAALAPSTLAQGQTLTATISNLDTTGTLTVYVASTIVSTQSASDTIVTYSAPNSLSGTQILGVSEGFNLATALFTVSPTGFVMNPASSVFGGSSVTVTVTYPPYAASITYSASINGSLLAQATSTSTATTWTLSIPANVNTPVTVYVVNSNAANTSTITAYAPTVSALAPSTFAPGQTLTATIGGLDATGTFTVYVNSTSISTQSASDSTVSYSIPNTLSGACILAVREGLNTATAPFSVTPTGFVMNPAASVFGGSLVTVTITYPPYPTSITYSADISGTLLAAATSPSNSTTWSASMPRNTNAVVSVRVFNGNASNSSSLTLYAPTFSLPYSTITVDTSFVVTMQSLTAGSYAASFSGPEYSTAIAPPAASSVWTITVPNTITSTSQLYTLGLSESGNSIASVYPMELRNPLAFTVAPSVSVAGGGIVAVSVLSVPYTTSVYCSAIMNGTTFASTVLPYTGSTWSFLAPTNVNSPLSIVLSNANSSATSTITDYAPTIVQPANGTLMAVGQLVVTPAGINTASPYSVHFGNGIYAFSNTISGTATAFTLPLPNNYIGNFVLTLAQAPNEQVLTYTVVKPVQGHARAGAFQSA